MSQPEVTITEQLSVLKINSHDRSGWADLEVKQVGSIRYGKAELKETTYKWRLTLRRKEQGWVLLAPQGRSFLRRDLAIRVFANQLAITSRASANSLELRRIVKVLDQLLAENDAAANVGSH